MALSRRTLREICRTNQARLVWKKIENFLAIPDVVSAGNHFGAGGEYFFRQARCDPETRRGIFAVSDAQVQAALRNDVRQAVVDNFPAGRSDDVADE